MDIIDKVLKFCFILSILFLIFILGFLSNDLKINRVYEGISFIINDIETRLNINLQKKFGDIDARNTLTLDNKQGINSNFDFYNKPKEAFKHYLLIKHDLTQPVLMDTPDRVIWTWDLSKFRNQSKMIALHLFDNGDLLLGKFHYKGIYRINKFGDILWSNPGLNHHWVDVENEKIFIPSRKFMSLPSDLNSNLANSELKNCNNKKSAFDTILILDSKNGKTLKNLSLMEKLIKNEEFKKILNEKLVNDTNGDICKDPLHLNDIQKLTQNEINLINSKISLTSNNIVILSFRNIDMVLFYDLDNNVINHIVVDLFKKQHSPRLHKDGYLYVFDNNDYSSVNSEIVKIDLQNNKIINSFMSKNFASPVQGRIQFLNDELFVQSSSQGEIFKVNCKNDFFEDCKPEYIYSSNFSFFYPSNHYDSSNSFKKDRFHIGDFYEKDKLNFIN
tara:strand:- start:708 stop:2045 length:1338 start_codon:yes stop_codon:yes gene_type:complete